MHRVTVAHNLRYLVDLLNDVCRASYIEPEEIGLRATEISNYWEEYLERIAITATNGGIWGEDVALTGLAEMLDFQVTVFYADSLTRTETMNSGSSRSIYLGLVSGFEAEGHRADHYCALKRR